MKPGMTNTVSPIGDATSPADDSINVHTWSNRRHQRMALRSCTGVGGSGALARTMRFFSSIAFRRARVPCQYGKGVDEVFSQHLSRSSSWGLDVTGGFRQKPR
jgi:hypothetical protein